MTHLESVMLYFCFGWVVTRVFMDLTEIILYLRKRL